MNYIIFYYLYLLNEEQYQLVMSIREEINHQKEINSKIQFLRQQIDNIILNKMIRL